MSAQACEVARDWLLGQPANTVTSVAFLVAGVAIAWGRRRAGTGRRVFAVLVIATGIGSAIEHGPAPAWADLAHDLPLMAMIAYLVVDAAADLVGRRLAPAWWIVPTAASGPVIVADPVAGDIAQSLLAAAAIGLWLHRARVRPAWRFRILVAVALLGVGGAIGILSRGGWPLCRPESLLQGHAVWHVLAAAALWSLGAVLGGAHHHQPAPAAAVSPRA